MDTDHSSLASDVAVLDRPEVVRPAGTPAPKPRTVRFSVVMPLYNKAAYVRAALQSVLAQTLDDFEVVVVDDGSTDGSAAIVESIGDPRVRLIRQPNSGVSVARNSAIREARGEWVVFLDADDWQHPQFLSMLHSVQQAHPQVHCVASRFVEFPDQAGTAPAGWDVPSGRPPVELIPDLAARWMRGATLFTGSIAVRLTLLQSLQPCFRPGESFGEDLELWFRISERTTIALTHVPLVGYRVDVQGSLTGRASLRVEPPWMARMHQRVMADGFDPARRRTALALIAQLRVCLAREAITAGERGRAVGLLLGARRAIRTPRWWFTAFMACWPSTAARRYLRRGEAAAPVDAAPAVLQPS